MITIIDNKREVQFSYCDNYKKRVQIDSVDSAYVCYFESRTIPRPPRPATDALSPITWPLGSMILASDPIAYLLRLTISTSSPTACSFRPLVALNQPLVLFACPSELNIITREQRLHLRRQIVVGRLEFIIVSNLTLRISP